MHATTDKILIKRKQTRLSANANRIFCVRSGILIALTKWFKSRQIIWNLAPILPRNLDKNKRQIKLNTKMLVIKFRLPPIKKNSSNADIPP